jgi:hypothetical protein
MLSWPSRSIALAAACKTWSAFCRKSTPLASIYCSSDSGSGLPSAGVWTTTQADFRGRMVPAFTLTRTPRLRHLMHQPLTGVCSASYLVNPAVQSRAAGFLSRSRARIAV